jgi:hypothetical protein
MVPIYDSDLAEDRWSKAEWSHYELWEKVEQRVRRHNRLWIVATAFVFLLLSSVPILMDQRPKWKTLSALRHLGQELNWIKRQASIHRDSYRIRFANDGSSNYKIEELKNCFEPSGPVVRQGTLADDELVFLSPAQGQALGVPGLLNEFCYDALTGSAVAARGETVAGFGMLPVKDLHQRMDRLSLLLVTGPSAEISFE